MARRASYGFFPAPGTDYTRGQEPLIAARLNRLARSLHVRLTGISGYRTPAHSVAVGGFPNDPHTQGEASDTPGIEGVPESTLRRFGLTRPLPGAAEADHIQLLGWKGGTTTARPRGQHTTLADLWVQAGGARNLAPIMAAIALAESGGRVDAVSPQNTNGTYDYGLWQINSSHSQFDQARLTSDPLYNARAAVAIEKSQGLTAWSTYNSGAFRSFMGQGRSTSATFGRTRPGGDTSGPDGLDTLFADYFAEGGTSSSGNAEDVSFFGGLFNLHPHLFGSPVLPQADPLKSYRDAKNAITDTVKFLQLLGWIIQPKHILQAVEFLTGLTIMGMGIHTLIEMHKGTTTGESTTRKVARAAITATPVGRAARLAQASRAGKAMARHESRTEEARRARKRARSKELGKQTTRRNEREMERKYGGVPF